MQGKTESGFEYEVDKEVFDDYEFLLVLAEVDDGKKGKIAEVVRRLLGEEQEKKLMEHVRNDKGRVSFSKMMKEVKDIIDLIGVKEKN